MKLKILLDVSREVIDEINFCTSFLAKENKKYLWRLLLLKLITVENIPKSDSRCGLTLGLIVA